MGIMLDLGPIKAREQAATEGPWIFDANGDWDISTPINQSGFSTIIVCGMINEHENAFEDTYPIGTCHDGEFMAHAREDVPALVAEVERLRAELADYKRRCSSDGPGLGDTLGDTSRPPIQDDTPKWMIP